jgi:hypothetical protein
MSGRNSRSSRATLLAAFAVLFQSVLFGWHHHEPVFAGHLPAAVIENHTESPQALDDEDGCEICQILHHLFAAPGNFVAPPHPYPGATNRIAADPAFAAPPRAFGFHARAPPLA